MNERRAFVVKFCLVRQPEYTSVTRALGELEARRPVQINVPGETLLILPVEGLDNQRLTEFASSGGREEEPFLMEASAASSAAAAAIQLVKLSCGLPAVLAASMIDRDVGPDYSIVASGALLCFATQRAPIRSPSLSASLILPSGFLYGFIRPA